MKINRLLKCLVIRNMLVNSLKPLTKKRSLVYIAMIALFAAIANLGSIANAQTVVEVVQVGVGPDAVAVNSKTNRIYVVNRNTNTIHDDNSVSVIDGASNEVIDTFSVEGAFAVGIAVNETSNMIYVSLSEHILAINGSDNSVAAVITERNITGFSGIAVNPQTNTIYVANSTNNGLCVIDGSINAVVGEVRIGETVVGHSVSVNPLTNRIYVANSGDNTVTVVDGASQTVIGSVEVGEVPTGIDVDAARNRIYVANRISAGVSVIDGADNSVINTIDVEGALTGIGVNANTNRIYVPKFLEGSVIVLDGDTGEVVDTVLAGDGSVQVGVNPASNLVYVTNNSSDDVTVIQDDGEILATPEPTASPSPTPKPDSPEIDLASLDVSPATARSSVLPKKAVVKALDGAGKAMAGITISAQVFGKRAAVDPALATTGADGSAEFKFRFGFVTKDGKITFSAEEVETSISQE